MSGTVVFEDAKLQAVELIAETVTLNNFSVSTATTFQQTTNASNVTTNTLRFTNPATAFVTTGNVEVGTANLFVDTTTGRVGIGTATPRWGLEVTHASGLGGVLSCSNDPIFSHNLYYSSGWKYGTASTGGAYMRMIDSEIQFWNAPNSGSGTWDTAGGTATTTQRMTIDESGNVGIGTTSPLEKLDVHGVSRISSAYPRLDFFCTTGRSTNAWGNSTGAAGDYRIYSNGDASDGTKRSLNFDYGQNTTHTTRMCINAAGNVGIGTTNPNTQLDCYVGTTAYGGIQVRSQSSGFAKLIANAGQGGHNSIVNAGDLGIVFSTDSDHTSDEANKGFYIAPWDSSSGASGIRINENGNVGIGTTTPYAKLHVASHGPTYTGISGNDRFRIEELVTNGHRYGLQMGIDWSSGNSSIQNYFQYSNGTYTHSYNLLLNPHGGNVGIGTTNPQGTLHIDTASNGEIMIGAITSSHATAPVCIRDIGGNQIHFYYAHTQVGKITSSSSSTSYQTTSDYRLKENVIPLVSALERVNDLPVYRFNFITDTEKTVDGFFAHEVQSVVPEAIDGVKDGTEDIGVITNIEDGKTIKSDVTEPTELKEGTEWTYTGSRPVYQSIDHSKLVPLLTRCIQELSAKNDALEARIAALENA